MRVISRQEALEERKKYYYTGKPCCRGHIARRYTSNTRCVECCNEDYIKKRSTQKKHKPLFDKRRALIFNMTDDQLAIARVIDGVCFEHPHIYGAVQRQTAALEKAKNVLETIDKLGYKKEDSMNMTAASMMVEGYGLI